MRIIVTGATGAIGRAALPRLIADGHEVVGLYHRPESRAWVRAAGAEPGTLDPTDPAEIGAALDGADAVVHLASAIPPLAHMHRARRWSANDHLRTAGTGTIVAAALERGVARVVLASITFTYVDRGERWISEDEPVEPVFRPTASALVAEEHVAGFAAAGGTGVSLRFAQLYGPGRASAELVAALRARKVPVVGAGRNFVSSVHVEDAGAAVAAALAAPSGRYNVGDDEPVRARDRLELQARALGCPPPRRVPAALARVALGRAAHQLAVSQRILNRRFRETTGWTPAFPSVADGWPSVVASAVAEGARR